MGKNSIFNTYCWENWTSTGKGNGIILLSYTKNKKTINLKWVKDLNVGPEAIKLLEEYIGDNLFVFGSLFGFYAKSTGNKSKGREVELYQTEKILHSKGNDQ